MQCPAGRSLCTHLNLAGLALILALSLNGCHSASVNATVHNGTASTVSLIQVDYPSASFGTQSLVPGQDFKYRFKVLGSGQVKITYTDTASKEHKATGPNLDEGAEGTLNIDLATDGAHVTFHTLAKSP